MLHRKRRIYFFISRHILPRCLIIAVPLVLILVSVLFLRHGMPTKAENDHYGKAENTGPLSSAAEQPETADTLREWEENTQGLNIIQQYAVQNDCYTDGKTIEVKGLMLHSVGCPQPSAQTYAEKFNTAKPNNSEVCPHAFLQSDGTVYQILPWNMYGWHAGGASNKTHIGIEMCEPANIIYTSDTELYATSDDAVEYAKGTYSAAVQLFAALCIRYSLDPLEEGVIISHTEGFAQGTASGHSDPEHLWQGLGLSYTMDTFRADVAAAVSALKG